MKRFDGFTMFELRLLQDLFANESENLSDCDTEEIGVDIQERQRVLNLLQEELFDVIGSRLGVTPASRTTTYRGFEIDNCGPNHVTVYRVHRNANTGEKSRAVDFPAHTVEAAKRTIDARFERNVKEQRDFMNTLDR